MNEHHMEDLKMITIRALKIDEGITMMKEIADLNLKTEHQGKGILMMMRIMIVEDIVVLKGDMEMTETIKIIETKIKSFVAGILMRVATMIIVFFDENRYSRRGFGSMGRHKYESETGYREHAWEPYSNGNRRSYSDGDQRREYGGERKVNRGYAEDQYSNPGMRGRNYDDLSQRNRGWDENRDYAFGKSPEKTTKATTSSRKKSSAKTTTKRRNSK
jgi:hypothetical protein